MTEEQPEEKQEPKPVNVKQNVQALVTALQHAEKINRYEVKQKDYPSDLKLYIDGGKNRINNPTLVDYIARAEKQIAESYIKEVIYTASCMIRKDLEEIRELLK